MAEIFEAIGSMIFGVPVVAKEKDSSETPNCLGSNAITDNIMSTIISIDSTKHSVFQSMSIILTDKEPLSTMMESEDRMSGGILTTTSRKRARKKHRSENNWQVRFGNQIVHWLAGC